MIAGVVLAAGASRRMGRVKQLLPLGGRPLLAWALSAMCDFAQGQTLLVLGHEAERIQETLDLTGVTVVINTRYRDGLSTSLQAGLHALGAEFSAAVIATGDQPFVTSAHLQALADTFATTGKPIVATAYGDHAGVPMLLAAPVWPLASTLQGDQGARPLLRDHPGLVAFVPAPDALMALDVDTEAAYAEATAAVDRAAR